MARKGRRRKAEPDEIGQISRLGLPDPGWRDGYHRLLTMSVPALLGFIAAGYLAANLFFALCYLVVGGVANAPSDSLMELFFFSVQTMATIGYGNMYPESTGANIIATSEAVFGLLSVALSTGVMFARISRPTARVLFSRVAVVAPVNGVPTLAFRVANQRRNRIVEAQMSVSVLRDETTEEGVVLRRFHDLPLVRSRTPLFALSWTVMHPIDAASPFYGIDPESCRKQHAAVICSMTGLDDTTVQTVHARHVYGADDIRWGMRFADIFLRRPDGAEAIDYSQFHETVEAPLAWREPRLVRPEA